MNSDKLINELQALNSRAVVDLNLSVNEYDISELSLLHTEVGHLTTVLRQAQAAITKRIHEVREVRRTQLPLTQDERTVPTMMRELRDDLFNEWEDAKTPPKLRKDNLLPGMQYTVPPLMRQLLTAMFEPRVGKDITIQSVVYDLDGPDPRKVLSFRFSVNTLKGLKTSMCVHDAPTLFRIVHEAQTMFDTSELEETTVNVTLDQTKPPQEVKLKQRKPKTKDKDGKTVVKKSKAKREAEEAARLEEKYKNLGF